MKKFLEPLVNPDEVDPEDQENLIDIVKPIICKHGKQRNDRHSKKNLVREGKKNERSLVKAVADGIQRKRPLR